MMLGEVDVVDCVMVAQKRGQFLSAPPVASHYMFLKKNIQKHQIFKMRDFPKLMTYQKVYAWILSKPTKYTVPKMLAVKPGCIVWSTVQG